MATLGVRIDEMREVVGARGPRIGMPGVEVTLALLDQLELAFKVHAVRLPDGDGIGGPWCLRCLENWPCQEVTAAEELLRVIERTEANGVGQADGETRA